jgi:hypothetical protein
MWKREAKTKSGKERHFDWKERKRRKKKANNDEEGNKEESKEWDRKGMKVMRCLIP